jgi:hypothetical protein
MDEAKCPYCGQRVQREPELAGQPVTCPKCGDAFTMPSKRPNSGPPIPRFVQEPPVTEWSYLSLIFGTGILVLAIVSMFCGGGMAGVGSSFRGDNAIGATANSTEEIAADMAANRGSNWLIAAVLLLILGVLARIASRLYTIAHILLNPPPPKD